MENVEPEPGPPVTYDDVAEAIHKKVPHAKRINVQVMLERSFPFAALGKPDDGPSRTLYVAQANVLAGLTEYSFGSAIRDAPDKALRALLKQVGKIPSVPDGLL